MTGPNLGRATGPSPGRAAGLGWFRSVSRPVPGRKSQAISP